MADTTPDKPRPTLAQVWQMPALLAGLLLLVVGFILAMPEPVVRDLNAELDAIEATIQQEQFDQAITELDVILNDAALLSTEQKARYHVLRADTIAVGQAAQGGNVPENHKAIVKNYQEAQKLGAELDDVRLARLSESLLALGKNDQAQELAETVEPESPQTAQELQRQSLESSLGTKPVSDQAVEALLRFLGEPELDRHHRIWAVARYGNILLDRHRSDEAAALLMRWLQRLDFAAHDDLGELMVLLGRAYLEQGDLASAERWYTQARDQLSPEDWLNGDALVGLGQIRFEEGNAVEASEYYGDVVRRYPMSRFYLDAMLGQAECEARLRDHSDALGSYDRAVEYALQALGRADLVDKVALSIEAQRDWRLEQGEYELALKYLGLEEKLYTPNLPASLLLKLASAHDQVAGQLLGMTGEQKDLSALFQALETEQRVRVMLHYEEAAKYYTQHALAVAESDPASYGESLWRAADAFDKAGLYDEAIRNFEEFAAALPKDPRQPMVSFRLGQAYQAMGQFDSAINMYRTLNENHPKSPEAYSALVPLAQAYLAVGADGWDQAEHILKSVVTDHPAIRPESQEYRRALVALGRCITGAAVSVTTSGRSNGLAKRSTVTQRVNPSPTCCFNLRMRTANRSSRSMRS